MDKVFDDIDCLVDEDEDDLQYNENTQGNKKYRQKTNAILFLIDSRMKMFSTPFESEESAFLACLKSIRNALRHKIFNEEKCHCGIILLGTKVKENTLNLGNLLVIHKLDILEASHILKIDEVIKDIQNSSYEKEYGFDNFSLGDAFWLSTHIFFEKAKGFNKCIMLFTNDDNPVNTEKNDTNRALSIAQDMYKNFILLEMIHLGDKFDCDKFYKKLLQASHHDVDYPIPKPITKLKELEKRVKKTNYKHLSLYKVPFVIGNNFEIGVSITFLVKKMKVPFKVKLSRATNEKVFSKMQMFETGTGGLVEEESIIKTQNVGQKAINFNMKELKFISNFGRVELRLLGFKPASVIGLENFVRPCAFLYPDETTHKGSSVFFTALLKRCIVKQVIPICTLTLRSKSANRFVALIAQSEDLKISETKDLPQGFIVFFLPFAEEIRPLDDTSTTRAEPEQVKAAVKFIKKLKFKYQVECFSNPRFKNHWAAVEALALDLKEPDPVNDSTVPNYDLMTARVGNLANEFMEAVYEDDYDPEVSGAPRKRAKPSSTKGGCQPEMRSEEVELLIRKGKGETLSNDVLKAYLKSVGEGKGLSKVKKSELLEKVVKYLDMN